MRAISAFKLSLEGGWSNRTVWVLYSRRSYTVRYVLLVLVCSRRNVILSCIWEWMGYEVSSSYRNFLSLSHTHTLSFSPFNLITRRRPPLSTIHTTTTTALKGSEYKGKKSLPRQDDCHPSLYTPPHTGLLFCRYSNSSSNEEEWKTTNFHM